MQSYNVTVAEISCAAVYYVVEGGSSYLVCGRNSQVCRNFCAAVYYVLEGSSNYKVCGRNAQV